MKVYPLDAVAKFYPMIMTKSSQSNFRISATLHDPIDKDSLQEAVNKAFLRFPYYKVKLGKTFFEYVLISNDEPFVVKQNDGKILAPIDWKENNNYLLEVSFLDNEIILETFHALGDGTSMMEFFKTILFEYLVLVHGNIENDGSVMTGEFLDNEEFSDPQANFYDKKSKNQSIKNALGKKAFCPTGKYKETDGFHERSIVVDSEKLYNLAKSHSATVTQYIVALALFSYARLYRDKHPHLVAFVPANMRKSFATKSMRNFVTFIKSRVTITDETIFQDILDSVTKDLKTHTTKDALQQRINFSTLLDRIFLTKYMPRFLLSAIVRFSKSHSKQQQTLIVSNLGVVKMPNDASKFIDTMSFMLNTSVNTPRNLAIVSFQGKTKLSFSSRLNNKEIEDEFFTLLTDALNN